MEGKALLSKRFLEISAVLADHSSKYRTYVITITKGTLGGKKNQILIDIIDVADAITWSENLAERNIHSGN